MSIAIESVINEATAFDKEINFTYEGEKYSVRLHWDKWDGYDLTFTDIDDPEWAINWEENNDGESLCYILDGLTDEMLEEE